jgi:hypothetical protein
VLVFWIGVGLIGRFTTGFVLLTEVLPKRHKAVWGTMMMVGDTAATLYITAYLAINPDATFMVWLGFAFNIISFIGIYFLTESPAWLVSVGRIQDAKRVLEKIARINGVEDFRILGLKKDQEKYDDDTKED